MNGKQPKVLKKTKNGVTERSYDGGRTWVSLVASTPKEMAKHKKEMEHGIAQGNIYPSLASLPDAFVEDLEKTLITYCNKNDIDESFKNDFAVALIGYQESFPEQPDIDFINSVIDRVKKIVEKVGEENSIVGLRISSVGDKVITFLKEKKGKSIREKSMKSSLDWKGTEDQLKELYEQLAENNKPIIQTTPEIFSLAFSKELKVLEQPILWNGSIRLLAYLFDCLYKEQLIGSNKWQSTIERYSLFINSTHKLINANDLSVAKSESTRYGSRKGRDEVDRIVKEVINIKTIKSS